MLLLPHIPANPSYLRVKVRRRLRQLGAVAVKQAVFALPLSDGALEDFQWLRSEIEAGGGEGSICEARFIAGLTDVDVEGMFRAAREEEYREIAEEARVLRQESVLEGGSEGAGAAEVMAVVTRLRARLDQVRAIDFFDAAGRHEVEATLEEIRVCAHTATRDGAEQEATPMKDRASNHQARTWVTRQGVFVDRMACCWLIRRFIDPDARFQFVADHSTETSPDEVRFDMYQGEFTHEGDLCTFEVLLERFGVADEALRAIAEIVHDLDLKESKYCRPETAGILAVLKGIVATTGDDAERVARASDLFDDLRLGFGAGAESEP